MIWIVGPLIGLWVGCLVSVSLRNCFEIVGILWFLISLLFAWSVFVYGFGGCILEIVSRIKVCISEVWFGLDFLLGGDTCWMCWF